jgi:arginyl-tRNA synthetase
VKISTNPFGEFRAQCSSALTRALNQLYPELALPVIPLDLPPSLQFGELASSLSFELAKKLCEKPLGLAEKIVDLMDLSIFPLIKEVKVAGGGYINFYVNFDSFNPLTLGSVRQLNAEYGYLKTENPRRIIVEHTSVNPLHPIHIGQARNSILGDAIARILKAYGHTVFTHYYIDDVGRQTAVIAYGYEKLNAPVPEEKPDHFIGKIYTITSCLVEIKRLKNEIEMLKKTPNKDEEILKIQRELDEWVSIAAELQQLYPELFNKLLDAISKDENPEKEVNRLIQLYERGKNEKLRLMVRHVCELCVEGFKQTLSRIRVFFDSWDWESELTWSNEVNKVLEKLRKTPYVFQTGNVLEFNAEKVAEDLNLKEVFGLRKDYEIPSLTLVRADGTTLYPTRDIAYSLKKFQKADQVINVIMMEQALPQLQLKLALCALGHVEKAKNLIHFTYNVVTLPGYRMSSRRGRYITLDEVVEEAIQKAYQEVSKKSPNLSEEKKREVAIHVGIGAVKYALVGVDPSKPVVFTWDRVLNFEKNSAPYIQYTHARACSILRKASIKEDGLDYKLLQEPIEHEIILTLARFPEIFKDAAENLKPHLIAEYANSLADKFNTFYNALPVIKAQPQKLSAARLRLVDASRIVLRNALHILSIEALERM